MNIAPSSVARTMAGAMWPDVQDQKKVAKGVYEFSCAGHGGLVAVLGVANLPTEAIAAAREQPDRFIELVAVRPGHRYTSVRYTKDSLRALAQNPYVELFECWVGEEDCDWATIALVSPEVREGMAKNGRYEITEQDARKCCERWNQTFLNALQEVAA